MTKQNTRRGFTLIELLVVVLIIGILAAVAVPQYQKAVYRSRLATLKHIVNAMAEAQEAYYLANDTYATKLEELDIDMPGGQLDTSDDTHARYNWGHCTLGNMTTQCRASGINLQYQATLKHKNVVDAGKRWCIAWGSLDLDTLANQVCKMDTGATTGHKKTAEEAGTNADYVYWVYQN